LGWKAVSDPKKTTKNSSKDGFFGLFIDFDLSFTLSFLLPLTLQFIGGLPLFDFTQQKHYPPNRSIKNKTSAASS
jgi:hypothetical protein